MARIEPVVDTLCAITQTPSDDQDSEWHSQYTCSDQDVGSRNCGSIAGTGKKCIQISKASIPAL